MKPVGWLLAGFLSVLPLSYEWVITHVGPFLFETLWQSVEAFAFAQLWGLFLVVAVVMPIVLACNWLKDWWDRLT